MNSFSIHYPKIGVAAWVVDRGKVLLGRRNGSFGSESWAPPGGHLEFGEAVEEGATRELKEETDLFALALEPVCWTTEIFKEEKKHYVSLHHIVTKYAGEVKLMEPHKCYEWKWFALDELPENLFLSARKFIESGFLQKYIEKTQNSLI
jgi:8-oxo-dGTP diphosphatase